MEFKLSSTEQSGVEGRQIAAHVEGLRSTTEQPEQDFNWIVLPRHFYI